MDSIKKIILPFPPSVNGAYAGKQRRYKSKKYKTWTNSLPALEPLGIKSPIAVQYGMYMPDERQRDISNYVKLCEDYLVEQKVIEDDNYKIVQLIVVKFCGIDRNFPRVEIKIKEIE